jgi:hypothetical protein
MHKRATYLPIDLILIPDVSNTTPPTPPLLAPSPSLPVHLVVFARSGVSTSSRPYSPPSANLQLYTRHQGKFELRNLFSKVTGVLFPVPRSAADNFD